MARKDSQVWKTVKPSENTGLGVQGQAQPWRSYCLVVWSRENCRTLWDLAIVHMKAHSSNGNNPNALYTKV
jgi:hypothetical protein